MAGCVALALAAATPAPAVVETGREQIAAFLSSYADQVAARQGER